MYFRDLKSTLENLTELKITNVEIGKALGIGASTVSIRGAKTSISRLSFGELKKLEEYFGVELYGKYGAMTIANVDEFRESVARSQGVRFGNRLKELRKALDFDVATFAEELDTKESTLYSYENGRGKPSYDLLIPLLNFNVNLAWLLSGHGAMFTESKNSFKIKRSSLKINKSALGIRVNKIRIAADLISGQMCEILNISERELAALISGEGKITLELIQKICENFDATADYLLFGKE